MERMQTNSKQRSMRSEYQRVPATMCLRAFTVCVISQSGDAKPAAAGYDEQERLGKMCRVGHLPQDVRFCPRISPVSQTKHPTRREFLGSAGRTAAVSALARVAVPQPGIKTREEY